MRRDPLRIFILIAAVAFLALAMCAHTQPPRRTQASPDAAPAQAPAPNPTYFPATKAPSQLYR